MGKQWLIIAATKSNEETLADESEVKQNFTEIFSSLLDFTVHSRGVGRNVEVPNFRDRGRGTLSKHVVVV